MHELFQYASIQGCLNQWWLPLAIAVGISLVASYLFARHYTDTTINSKARAGHEDLFQAVFENAAIGMAKLTLDWRILQINQHFCDLLDRPRELLLSSDFDAIQITFPDDRQSQALQIKRLLCREADSFQIEKRYNRPDGSVLWANLAVQLVRTDKGEPSYFIAVMQDTSDYKRAEQNLLLAASVYTCAREGIMMTELNGAIINVNGSFTSITGYNREEALGKTPRLLKSGRQTDTFYDAFWQSLQKQGNWHGEIWNRHKSGELFAVMQTITLVRDERGQPRHYVSLFSDITVVKHHQQQLEHMAHYDALTGLPNRVLLVDRLKQAMLTVQRRSHFLAVVYLDLDGFKALNDTLGHDAGDSVLSGTATRMKTVLREGDTLSRIGGDEFVAVLTDLPDVNACAPLLERLLLAASEPILWRGKIAQVSASLGVTFFPQAEAITAEQLQRQADQAMYQAKVSGKNRYHVFDAEHDRSVRGKHENLEYIRSAMTRNELLFYYQPKVNMRTGRVVGAEALLRWQHPERGLLLPGAFLPEVEDHPLAVNLGEWGIHTALRQMQTWRAQGLNLTVSVNVGGRQLQQGDFVARLCSILVEYPDLPSGCLELEVLETSALDNIDGVSQVIEDCKAIGVTFALDDFGTGYSSLTYLRRLPIKVLKIDQSFVRGMLNDPDDLTILKGVIGLAHAFHRDVIAEGVETVVHGTALLRLGCELAQGYGIARPMPAEKMIAWVKHWRPDQAWNPDESWRFHPEYHI